MHGNFKFSLFYLFKVCVCVCAWCVCVVCVCTYMKVKGQLAGVGLAFHHVGLRDRTQVIRLGSKNLSLLSPLSAQQTFLSPITAFKPARLDDLDIEL